MTRLRASDISLLRGADPLWRRRSSGLAGEGGCEPYELVARHGLPRRGFASPLGFWFAPAGDWTNPPPYRLEVAPTRRPGARVHAGDGMPGIAEGRRLGVVVAPPRRPGVSEPPPPMALEVAGRSARIEVDEAAWPEARAAGLLAVATCWRLEALDGALDRLTDRARMTLERPGRSAQARRDEPGSCWQALHREAYALILDLPEFEGPLTDPSSFLPSREAARLYRRLCGRLGLFAWRDRLDERAEVLEGLLETLTAGRDHRQAIALQIGLEALIIAVLAAEVAVSLASWAWE
jgi:hypothetical protein